MTAGIVAYYRVSTAKQGVSGLGLEAQQAAVDAFARREGRPIVASYVEVESGKKSDRPELARALGHARRAKATLAIAKLDRLSRNVAFLANLLEAGVDFVAVDQPHATRLTLHLLAAVAEHEASMISQRTKAALAAYKARGGLLGASRGECRNLNDQARKKGTARSAEVRRAKAVESVDDLLPIARQLRDSGDTLRAIAARLNADGHLTRNGRQWTATQVMRMLKAGW